MPVPISHNHHIQSVFLRIGIAVAHCWPADLGAVRLDLLVISSNHDVSLQNHHAVDQRVVLRIGQLGRQGLEIRQKQSEYHRDEWQFNVGHAFEAMKNLHRGRNSVGTFFLEGNHDGVGTKSTQATRGNHVVQSFRSGGSEAHHGEGLDVALR